jgi:hypothetical protein
MLLRYDLRLYRHEGPSSPAHCDDQQIEFEAEDDMAAVERATSVYAFELASCHHAMLSSVGGRLIWQKRATP